MMLLAGPLSPVALVRGSVRTGWSAATAAARGAAALARPPVAVLRTAADAVDAGRTRSHRRVWSEAGRALVQVRGLDATNSVQVVRRVQQATTDLAGVQWAQVEVMSGRLQVRFDPDVVDVAEIVTVVAEAEAALGHSDTGFSQEQPDHPSDVEPVHLQALALAADVAGLVAAIAGRLPGLPSLPGSAGAAVALFDTQPRLRRSLESRLGPAGTDLALGLANAAVLGLSQGTASLAVDTALRTQALLAAKVRREAFLRCHDELCGPHRAPAGPAPVAVGRPVPRPPGPVERLSDRAASGSLIAVGGLLTATRSVDLAGHAALVGVPRAARFARESFAAALAMVLARRNQIVLDDSVLRRLDRVSAIIVDTEVLDSLHPMVLEADTCADDWTPQHVWMAAQRLLWADGELSIPPPPGRQRDQLSLTQGGELAGREATDSGVRRLHLRENDRQVGSVLVGWELDPYADALLGAARAARLRLVLTDRANLAELSARADEVLPSDSDLASEVRRLQADGGMVAVVSRDDAALAAADVGFGVLPAVASSRVPWGADVLCGPGLPEVCRLLSALPAAAGASSRGVTLSVGGGFLGVLLLALPGRGGRGRATLPGTIAAGIGLVEGTLAGVRVGRRPGPAAVMRTPWHALEPDEVLARLPHPPDESPAPDGAIVAGLRAALAPVRIPLQLMVELTNNVRAELADPLTPVLTTGAAASAVIGSPTDAALVGGVLAANAVISGAQRLRADRALRVLLLDQQLPARRISPGPIASVHAVRARDLRLGDIIELRVNDVVPADARILSEHGLEVDEASLTGESVSVGKQVQATPGADLPDRACMLYDSTTILAGSARAVVVATGQATEAGRALAIAAGTAPPAGMQVRLQELTQRALPVTLLGGAAVTGLGLLRRQSFRSAVASGVSVAVAAVPEGLPLVATVAQLSAARRLSRLGILVRSSRTIEALGRVDTVCFDKTGTLTEGRLRLVRVAGLDSEWQPDDPSARRVLLAAARSCPEPEDGQPATHATDQAVLDAARRALGTELGEGWRQLAEVPFQSGRGYSAAVGQRAGGVRLVVKGAPEVLLPRCTHHRDDTGKHRLDRAARQRAADVMDQLAGQGLRVLAVGRRRIEDASSFDDSDGSDGTGATDFADLAEDLTLLGFVALADTPRPEARPTVDVLRGVGITPVMITGDHPVTARAVAEDLGIPADSVVTGTDLEGLDDLAETACVTAASVFARVSPEQKVRIVAAFRRAGRTVAMTGDGANDAAAIRVADVGIAMAARGSTSARTAADLVLIEPDVGLILEALVEGRAMWQRVRDAVSILVGGNAGEVAFTLAGTALSGRAPIGTRQFLLVNLLTDLAPSMAVALTSTDRSAALPVLLSRAIPSLSAPLLRDIAVRGGATSLGALAAWQFGRITGRRQRASTMALAALVGTQLGQTLVVGGRNRSVVATGVGSAVALAAIIQTPGVSHFFGCTPLGPVAWTTVLCCSAAGTLTAVLIPRMLGSHDPFPESAPLGNGWPPAPRPIPELVPTPSLR